MMRVYWSWSGVQISLWLYYDFIWHLKMENTIGLGTRKLTGQQCYDTVMMALHIGYQYIDTASVYHNHDAIGQAIQDSDRNRSDLWITSKIWVADFDTPYWAVDTMLSELQTEYLDLVLLHRPTCRDEHHRVFDALLHMQQEDKVRHIGISNFSYSQCDDAIAYLGNALYTVQYEYHVCLDQSTILDKCRQHNIIFEAYSPLGHGKLWNDKKTIDTLDHIAKKHHLTLSQVMLSWLLDQWVRVLPKSTSLVHLQENFLTPTGILNNEDRDLIACFPKYFRYCNPSAIAPDWVS